MIYLFTDFGSHDIYVGQLKAALLRHAPAAVIVDLLHDAPDQEVLASAHLLAALADSLPKHETVMLAVVDPGVGGTRRPIVLQADGRWYVGPDNGLLSVVKQRALDWRVWEIVWRPQILCETFHGRDLFAPVAAMLASGAWWDGALLDVPGLEVELDAADLHQVIYIDHYGNAMTGIRQGVVPRDVQLSVCGSQFGYARVFTDVPMEGMFWYENSIGLVEIAANRSSAARELGLVVGTAVQVINSLARPESAKHPAARKAS